MRLATVRTGSNTHAARLDGDDAVVLHAGDVGELLASGDLAAAAADETGAVIAASDVAYATLVTRPAHIYCAGYNYTDHLLEMGHDLPTHPTLFAKFPSTLIGAFDDIALPAVSEKADWEVELGVVIGRRTHRVRPDEALGAIAGYTVINDVSMRDWQRRTANSTQGKTFDATCPVGPALVTLDELDDPFDLEIRCELDGEVMQQTRTSKLLFGPLELVSYCSQIVTLLPGDLIATGTCGGVGDGRTPPVYMHPGQELRTFVGGVGECVNRIVAES